MSNVAHYRGDCTGIAMDRYVGPDTAGAYYAPVTATYDADTDRTTVKFRPLPPAELRKFVGVRLTNDQKVMRLLRGLYGG